MSNGASEIAAFRGENFEALMDSGHPDHAAKVEELSEIYKRAFPEPEGKGFDPMSTVPEKPQVDPDAPFGAMDPHLMAEVAPKLKPAASPDDYEFASRGIPEEVAIGDGSERVPVGIDKSLEADARKWMFDGEVTPAEASGLWHAYADELERGFTDERIAENEQAAMRMLQSKYGGEVNAAIRAGQRLMNEIGGEKLVNFLSETGLGSHPRVVMNFVNRAKALGYF